MIKQQIYAALLTLVSARVFIAFIVFLLLFGLFARSLSLSPSIARSLSFGLKLLSSRCIRIIVVVVQYFAILSFISCGSCIVMVECGCHFRFNISIV